MIEKKCILKQAKKNKEVVYGSQAIKKHIGFYARTPNDFDLMSKNPLESARQIEKKLDKKAGGDYYYIKPSKHKGTVKVKHKGWDGKKGTKDDLNIADYSKMREIQTKKIEGVRYAQLSETVKDKTRSLKSKEFAYRHNKDREDLERIRFAKKIQTMNERFKNG